jgi:hypothetical protein
VRRTPAVGRASLPDAVRAAQARPSARRDGIGRRLLVLAAAAALASGVLGGCADLPRSGPVHAGPEGTAGEEFVIRAFAAGPARGANVDQIVEGFLQAMLAGATDDFKVARSYLADDIAGVWDPSASVMVYQSGEAPLLTESANQSGRVTMTVTQVGEVDDSGRYQALEATTRMETLHLALNDDSEWRISELPDGTVIPEDVFRVDYHAAPLYFPSTDGQYLVPDRRVFPRQSAATEAARQFLAGPPSYLTDAVGAVVPTGTKLATEAVKVVDGVAVVDLSGAMSRASESARATVLACLTGTLTALPEIRSVRLQVEGAPLQAEPWSGLTTGPQSAGGPFYLAEGGVWRFDSSAGLVAGTEPAGAWETLTVDHSTKRFAGMANGRVQVILKAGEEPVEWAAPGGRTPTAPPVFDRLGSLWVAVGEEVAAFNSDGEVTVLGATWLEDMSVVGLAASQDGSRLALAVERPGEDGVAVAVTGIARGEGAAPARLTGPLWAGAVKGPVSSLSWADGLTLAMLAPPAAGQDAAPALLTVGGDLTFLKAPVDLPASLTAGRGPDDVFVAGKAGGLFAYSSRGRVWSSLTGGAHAVVLAP